jgi:hypothetical protein
MQRAHAHCVNGKQTRNLTLRQYFKFSPALKQPQVTCVSLIVDPHYIVFSRPKLLRTVLDTSSPIHSSLLFHPFPIHFSPFIVCAFYKNVLKGFLALKLVPLTVFIQLAQGSLDDLNIMYLNRHLGIECGIKCLVA